MLLYAVSHFFRSELHLTFTDMPVCFAMYRPALTIHSVVRYSALALKKSAIKSAAVKTWLPTALGQRSLPFLPPLDAALGADLRRFSSIGLSVVPALPYLFDAPVEHVTETMFKYLETQFVTDVGMKRALNGHKVHEKQE